VKRASDPIAHQETSQQSADAQSSPDVRDSEMEKLTEYLMNDLCGAVFNKRDDQHS